MTIHEADAQQASPNRQHTSPKQQQSHFHDYARAGFGADLLPILPYDALINADSPSRESLEKHKGKVPGRKFARGWMGFANWTQHRARPSDIGLWTSWDASVGMQGRRFPALDIDVDDPELADAICREAISFLGEAPIRFGRGSRRVLVYSGAGIAKRRIAFGRQDLPTQAIELLGDGQFYVVEGVHPATKQPYYWQNERSLASVGPDGLISISPERIDAFFARVGSLIESFGCEVTQRSKNGRGAATVCQEGLLAPSISAIERALAGLPNEVGYDDWITLGRAVRASAGPDRDSEGLALFTDWSLTWGGNTPEVCEAKWASFSPPHKVGWDYLASYATEHGDGTFNAATEDFDAVAEAPVAGTQTGPLVTTSVQAMFNRYVWVEALERACDLTTGELLTRTQFNVRNAHLGDPTKVSDCAWAIFISNPRRLKAVKGVTYRPNGELFVTEDLPGLVGPCVNLWHGPTEALPTTVTDADVGPWLDHVALVIPDERERGIVLDWLAWIIQNPGAKPNWAVLIGSTWEGMGKDLMLDPVRMALGAANVREIGPGDIMSQWTWWAANTRLVIVEEMHSFERKETMNRLKPLIAAPPYTLTINKKGQPQYEVPNLIASIFFTNMDNALALSKQDRRFMVCWNDGRPREKEYYAGLVAWYAAGGCNKAARWLQLRDVSGFDAKGRAPDTEAKGAMARASRTGFEELIEDDLNDGEGCFSHSLFALEEVVAHVNNRLGATRKISPQRVAAALRRLNCDQIGRGSLGEPPEMCRHPGVSLRRESTVYGRCADHVLGASPAEIKAAYWAERRVDVA